MTAHFLFPLNKKICITYQFCLFVLQSFIIIQFIHQTLNMGNQSLAQENNGIDQRSLKLYSKGIKDSDLSNLIEDNKRKNLPIKKLNLSHNSITQQGVKCLLNGMFSHIKVLYLFSNKIGNKGVKYLSNGSFQNLTNLNIGTENKIQDNQIEDEGAKHLSSSPLENLKALYLHDNKIGNEGASQISKGFFSHLATLSLSDNKIGNKGAMQLCISLFNNLSSISLDKNKITRQSRRKLQFCELRNKKGQIIQIAISW